MSPQGRTVVSQVYRAFFPDTRVPDLFSQVQHIFHSRHRHFPDTMPAGLWQRFLHKVEEELEYPDESSREWILEQVHEELALSGEQLVIAEVM